MFRVTFEAGPSFLIDEDARLHFLRQAARRRHPLTRVRGGHVVTIPGRRGPRMVSLLEERA